MRKERETFWHLGCIEEMIQFCEERGFDHRDFYSLKELVQATNPEAVITVTKIKKVISKYFGLSAGEIDVSTRHKRIRFPRQLAHYFAALLTEDTDRAIGRKAGGKDHATVINSRKKINNLIETKYPIMDYNRFLELELMFAPYLKKAHDEQIHN